MVLCRTACQHTQHLLLLTEQFISSLPPSLNFPSPYGSLLYFNHIVFIDLCLLIPASNKSYTRSVFQANGSFVSTSFEDLPFESFCFNQEGSCSNTNCLAKYYLPSPFSLLFFLSCPVSSNLCFRGDIAAYSTSKTFSVDSLRPSGVYFLSFNTTSFGDNVPYSLDVQGMFSSSTSLVSPLCYPSLPSPFSPITQLI